jgi:hypothetical protein
MTDIRAALHRIDEQRLALRARRHGEGYPPEHYAALVGGHCPPKRVVNGHCHLLKCWR